MPKDEDLNTAAYGKLVKYSREGLTPVSAGIVDEIEHATGALTTDTMQEEHPQMANKWAILMLAAMAGFITNLDGSIVNIALPAISRTFHVGVSGTIEWIIIGYLVVIAATLLTFGRLADMLGRKPIFLTGLLVFVIGSALCGLAPTLLLLILARLFQGLGGALIAAVNVAMITSAFQRNERGLALGLNAVIIALGISAGPTIGGIITQYLSWRWIFYVNVPTCLVVLPVAFYFYREERPKQGQRGRFDPLGAVTFAISLASLTLGLSFGREWGWLSPGLLSVMGLGISMLILALYIENHVEHPILDLSLLHNRTFAFANISFIFCMMALFAPGFIMPFYFEQLRGFSTIQTGLLMSPLPLTFAIAAPFSGAVADRFGSRWLSPVGLAIACIGLFLLSQVNAQSSMLDIIWRLIITGMGQGIFQSPNTRTMMGAAPSDAQGEASGLLATGRVIGQSVGVAIMGTIFAGLGGALAGNILSSQAYSLTPTRILSLQNIFINGFHAALLNCSLLAAIGIFTALARGRGATFSPDS